MRKFFGRRGSKRVVAARAAFAISLAGGLAGCSFESATIPGVSAALESGLRQARGERDAGRRECAFARVEKWRRGEDPKLFHRAFEVVFLGRPPFDPSPRHEAELRARLAPDDYQGAIKLADIYISRSDWKQAEPLIARAIALRPDEVEPIAILARIRDIQGEQAAARKLMHDFADRHPDSPTGILLRLPEKHGPERREALEAAVKAHPENGELLFNLAIEVQEAGDDAGAEALFLRAAARAPESAGVQAWTARFLLKGRDKRREALDYYYRAYFLDPDFYETEFVEARIGRMLDESALAGCD